MLHRHPLGAPRRAGGVDHREELGRVAPGHPGRGSEPGELLEVDPQDPLPALLPGSQAPAGHQRPGAGVPQHGVQALPWIVGIEGDVGASHLENAQDSRHQVRGTVEEDPHPRLGGQAESEQPARHLAGPRRQLAVGHRLLTAEQGRSPGSPRRLLREQLVHGPFA